MRRPGDVEPPAGHVDAVRHRGLEAVGDRGGYHHRAGAGAAGTGLTRATLVDPHAHMPLTHPGHELDVDAVGVNPYVVRRRRDEATRVAQVVDERHRVRVAHAHVRRRPGPTVDADLGLADHLWVTEVSGHRAVVGE